MADAHSAREPYVPNEEAHPWRRFVAMGDSFTEGIGDPMPGNDELHRGWADRVAEVLGEQVPDFAYANLAVRGKLIGQIVETQLAPAIELQPDLVSLCAGGNDVIRPGTDPDDVAAQFEDAVVQLSETGAAIVIFTGIDTNFSPVLRQLRGKVAIYNENLRAIADKHDCIVADQWALKEIQDPRFFDADRLHLNSLGHHEIARMFLRALNVQNNLLPMEPQAMPHQTWRQARVGDFMWAREFLMPWVLRRLRHQSSGDNRSAKRPSALPVELPDDI